MENEVTAADYNFLRCRPFRILWQFPLEIGPLQARILETPGNFGIGTGQIRDGR